MPATMITIPRFLHELHGERTTRAALVSTYTAVLAGVLVVLFVPAAGPGSTTWWRVALTALLAADLFGGVVSNFTPATDHYYGVRPRLRLIFLAAHVIHPALLYLAVDGDWLPWVIVGGYTVASAFAVNAVRRRAVQEPLAAALVALGILLVTAVPSVRPALAWFTPVFLVKLVLGFAVRRPEEAPERSGSS
jgi:hypothetical protein